MAQRFAELTFGPAVRSAQEHHGSAAVGARLLATDDRQDRLGPDEKAFLEARDGFHLATVTADGWPYVQFRGGPAGFVHVLDETTIGWADLRGNRQYITAGKPRPVRRGPGGDDLHGPRAPQSHQTAGAGPDR